MDTIQAVLEAADERGWPFPCTGRRGLVAAAWLAAALASLPHAAFPGNVRLHHRAVHTAALHACTFTLWFSCLTFPLPHSHLLPPFFMTCLHIPSPRPASWVGQPALPFPPCCPMPVPGIALAVYCSIITPLNMTCQLDQESFEMIKGCRNDGRLTPLPAGALHCIFTRKGDVLLGSVISEIALGNHIFHALFPFSLSCTCVCTHTHTQNSAWHTVGA